MLDLIKKTKSGLNGTDVKLALTELTKCGMGLDFRNGFLVLPNFNPVSGDVDGFYALYIVDGNIVIDPVDEAIAARFGYCTNSNVSATSVTISGCLPATDLEIADTRQLTATVLPSGAVQTGTWTTSDADIATVSVAGLVTGVAEGEVTITFTSTDGGFTATCAITVVEA